ncbi:TetR/AcrR family transcriptional regulator [Streptomyces sp. NPDC087440]|uniref:TetR/AcrR family transcriptional regulator n=1 Tax=Streptomyces sp. NPDC087440 TaxID=3365790 RepID=UPI0037F2D6EA
MADNDAMSAPHTPSVPPDTLDTRPGLRERKKIKTRLEIRRATFRLVSDQGWDATTIDQIAEEAEVSPSTVIRYFPVKEDIVLPDEYDPVMEGALRQRPADEPLLESVRAVVTEAMRRSLDEEPDEVLLRTRLMLEVPAVRARMVESVSVTSRMLCRVIAERTGRDAGELEVRIFATGLLAAVLETTLYWAERGQRDDLVGLIDRMLRTFEGGLVRIDG